MSLGPRHRSDKEVGVSGEPGGLTILVAEDEPGVRAYVGRVLQTQGYHVLEAVDGVGALEVAAEHPWPIHLLLTDLAMPRLDGCELHRRLKHQHPETKTLYMSGYFVPGLQPAAAFLAKPIIARVLLRKVSEVLQIRVQRTGVSQTRAAAPDVC